ncbi:MAG TPA: TonB-dependent receptor, partial [Arachidicoccus soli]|nr:TonB-dependent receptor [Arachidicoccus soli]
VPKHRGFINLEYQTKNLKWSYDLTMELFGTQRLAKVLLPNGTMSQKNTGEVVPMLSAQITYHLKNFDIYLGGENILDRRLKNPIIDVKNPFSRYFDATRVYSSIFGVNVYVGFRLMLPQKEKHKVDMHGMGM